jgi:hypothetical protein
MSPSRAHLLLAIAVLLLITSCVSLAASTKVERTGALSANGVSDAARQAVEDKGYRVTLDDGWTAEFWFARQVASQEKDSPGALYPKLAPSAFVGIVKLAQGMSDFRGQSIAAGLYTLRYELLPQDGNHMGVAPNPDFLLASPAADDARPQQLYVPRKLVALSAKATGTGHPAVIALDAAGEPSSVVKQEDGSIVFTVELSIAGTKQKLGIVIKGTAAQ